MPSVLSSIASLSPTSCLKSNGDLGTRVGLGVGIPLWLLALEILSFLAWRELSKRKSAAYSSAVSQNRGSSSAPGHSGTPAGHVEILGTSR